MADINLDKKRFNLPKASYKTYNQNLKNHIIHELLHICAIQNVNTGEKSVLKFGFSSLSINKPELKVIYNDFYDSINEFFNLSLMPNSSYYKRKNSITEYGNPMQKYLIDESFVAVGLHDKTKNKGEKEDIYLENGLPLIEDNLYVNVSNIIELFAHLVGEKELFVGMLNNSEKFVKNFNTKYKSFFDKYSDIIALSSNSIQQLTAKGYNPEALEAFDTLACLVHDYLYQNNMISQELAQTVLLECLVHSNIDKDNWETTKNKMQQIKNVLTIPKYKRENYEVSLVEIAYDKLEDKAYLNEPIK